MNLFVAGVIGELQAGTADLAAFPLLQTSAMIQASSALTPRMSYESAFSGVRRTTIYMRWLVS